MGNIASNIPNQVFCHIFMQFSAFMLLQLHAKNLKNRMLRFVRELKNLTSTHVRLKNFKTTPLIFYNTILHIFHLPL